MHFSAVVHYNKFEFGFNLINLIVTFKELMNIMDIPSEGKQYIPSIHSMPERGGSNTVVCTHLGMMWEVMAFPATHCIVSTLSGVI